MRCASPSSATSPAIPAKILTHVVGGLEERVVMRYVWLTDAALQFSGECRGCLGRDQVIFPRLLRLIGEHRKCRKLSAVKPQAHDRRLIYFLLGRTRKEPVPHSTDRKDSLKPSSTFDIRSLLGTSYKTLLSSTFGSRKVPSPLIPHPFETQCPWKYQELGCPASEVHPLS